jgi:hypothetical protein
MAVGWSRTEVEATVADYLDMLEMEVAGIPYVKTEHRRRLRSLLSNRSDPAIERKHMNISAVLRELEHPWIHGYKPLGNYQGLLWDVVVGQLETRGSLSDRVLERIRSPIAAPEVPDILSIASDPPAVARSRAVGEPSPSPGRRPRRLVNYLALEAAAIEIGRQGEQLVLEYEDARLRQAGKPRLAAKIDQVSVTQGDGLGYDIHSFDESGRDRLIEVKATRFGDRTPFYATLNEVECSRERSEEYYLYRVHSLDTRVGLFLCPGRLDRNFDLMATQFKCRIA